jgi:hypothetical protein
MATKTKKQTMEEEILEAVGIKPQKAKEDRQDYLERLARAVNNADEEAWDGLSEEAQDWHTAAVASINKKKKIAEFSDAVEEEEDEEEEDEEEEDDEPAPKAKGKKAKPVEDEDDDEEEEEEPAPKAKGKKAKAKPVEVEDDEDEEEDEEDEEAGGAEEGGVRAGM